MTTTLTPPALSTSTPTFGRLVGVELSKLVDTRAMLATLAVAALSAGAAGGGAALTGASSSLGDIAQMSLIFVPYVLVGIGAALVASEAGHRTSLTTFALVPRRGRVLAAKAAAMTILALAAAALGLLAAVLISLVVPALGLGPIAWDLDLGRFLVVTAGLLISALIGWALGAATGSMALALAAFLLWPMVSRLVGTFSDAATRVLDWVQPDMVYQLGSGVDTTVVAQTTTGLLVWLVAPAIIGWFRITKGEIR